MSIFTMVFLYFHSLYWCASLGSMSPEKEKITEAEVVTDGGVRPQTDEATILVVAVKTPANVLDTDTTDFTQEKCALHLIKSNEMD